MLLPLGPALGMIRMLENAGAPNYLSLTVEIPDVGRYGITIQRCDGKTPAERIAELEGQLTARDAQPCGECGDDCAGYCRAAAESAVLDTGSTSP